ncbi:histidinol dehydrogenase, partial [Acinetobacter sp. UBA3132]
KRAVFGQVGIDMIAGPSEILVYAEGENNAEWLAMDLLSQAEHDTVAQAVFITPDEALLNAVGEWIEKHLEALPKAEIARTSIENRGALVLVKDRAEGAELINQVAPEHLMLCLDEAEKMAEDIRHAGAIFMGRYTPEAIGDYCAGPNHVLPTSGTARFSSPLGVYDFQKRSSLIMCSEQGVKTLAKTADILAQEENLDAHARSARYRYQ